MAEGGRHSFDSGVKMKSKLPRKQRLERYSATHHVQHKFLGSHLGPELVKKHGTRSLPVRKGDKVKILRGDFAGMEGEVTEVDYKGAKVYVQGVTFAKADGTQVQKPVHASKVMIVTLVEDAKRNKVLERRSKGG